MLQTSSLCLFSINLEPRTLTPHFHCLSSKCFTFLSWPFHALSSTYSTKIKSKSMIFPPPVPYFFIFLFLHADLHLPLRHQCRELRQKSVPLPGLPFFSPGYQVLLSQAQPICRSKDPLSVPPHHSTSASTTALVSAVSEPGGRCCKINSPITCLFLADSSQGS